MEKLIVKNFGAIKDIEIELKNLTIFIGKSGTGKSTLAKLISIFRSIEFWKEEKSFQELLEFYEIETYLKNDTFIEYKYSYFLAKFEDKQIKVEFDIHLLKGYNTLQAKYSKNLGLDKILLDFIYQTKTIPAERQLTSRLSEKYVVLENENVTEAFPNTLINFIAEWNHISDIMSGSPVQMFDVTYEKGKDGKDYIILPNETKLLMNVAASGMQTVIPALLVMDYYSSNKDQKRSFVFEEPELNLFPYAQEDLVKFIADKVLDRGHQLVICTHSDHIVNTVLVLCKKFEEEGKGIDSNQTQIYFLSDNESEQAILMPIHNGGRIYNPPEGFFDKIDSDQEYLMGF